MSKTYFISIQPISLYLTPKEKVLSLNIFLFFIELKMDRIHYYKNKQVKCKCIQRSNLQVFICGPQSST